MIFASDVEEEIFCAAASARGVAVEVAEAVALGAAEGFVADAVPAADVGAGAGPCGARALGATFVIAVGGFGVGPESLQPTIQIPAHKRQATGVPTRNANAFDFIAQA